MLNQMSRFVTGMHHVLWTFPDKIIEQRIAPGALLHTVFPAQTKVHTWPQGAELPRFILQVLKQTRTGRGDKWHIGLPLEYFTLVNFSLPQAAGESLDQAVRYALMRHVPFDLNATYTDYRLLREDDQLEIAAVVAQKDMVDPIIDACAQSNIGVRSIFPSLVFWALASEDGGYLLHARGQTEVVLSQEGRIPLHLMFRPSAQEDEQSFAHRGATLLENIPDKPDTVHIAGSDDSGLSSLDPLVAAFAHTRQENSLPSVSASFLTSAPYSISLLSSAVKKQEKTVRLLRISGFVFLLLSLMAFPLADLLGTMRYKDRLEDRVDTVQRQVQEVESIRNENQRLIQFFEMLAQKVQSQPRAAHILKETTEVIPETAWLYSFHYADKQVRIQGEGDSATAVLEALENSPMFENVQFDSPVQKSGSRDRFKIVAKVVL